MYQKPEPQVFSSDWFDTHQERLLRFANTRYGRRVLKIHGQRSSVGHRVITKIEPHAITWDNGDGTLSTEFRTHDKYAKRLYYAFKPLWYGAHTWDMVVANNLARRLNLGFDTLTAFPETGNGTFTVDGYVDRSPSSDESFTTIRNGIGTDADTGLDFIVAQIETSFSVTNLYQNLFRFITTFNTQSVPAGSLVTAATLSLNVFDKFSGMGLTPLIISGATPNQTNRLSPADYQQFGSTSYASVNDASLNFDTYYDFALNSSGVANVNAGGITSFGGRLGWDFNAAFTGSWSSGNANYYSFHSADTSGSSFDPKLVVTYTSTRTGSASGGLRLGGTVTAKTTHQGSASGGMRDGGTVNPTKDVAPVAGKEYIYRVYDSAGTYIGIWPDVNDILEFTQKINTPGTTATVHLARSANATVEKRDSLTADDSTLLTTDDGQQLIVDYVTNQTVGTNTDVDLGYLVDVYVHYGGFDKLQTDDGQVITTDTGEELLISIGAPLGRRVFSGWIMDYAATYGDQEGVEVTLASHGSELANAIINTSGTTTVSYASTDHGQVIKNVLAMNSGLVNATSSASTVLNTGTTINPTFRLNTILEGIESVYKESPAGWYWYGNVAENAVYFKAASATADHTFILGAHISGLKVSRSIENLVNDYYFVGGDPGTGVFYKHDTYASPFTRKGLDRETDRRVWLLATYQRRRDKQFSRYGDAIYTTTITIISEKYDIESIQLGQVVGFANFGNFIDGLKLQIVSKQYSAFTVTLELGELLQSQAEIIDDTSSALQDEQYTDIPSAPS